MDTRPDIATECVVSAGSHTARSGGTTHKPCPVVNVITPSDANKSWSSGCECAGTRCPSASSADTLAMSAAPRPLVPASMLWHLCDICCHNSERKKSAQVLFLSPKSLRRQNAGFRKDGRVRSHHGLRPNASLLRRQARIRFRQPRSICAGDERWRPKNSYRKSSEFHSASRHYSGLGSKRYSGGCDLASKSRCHSRKISVRSRSRAWNLDCAFWR